MIIVRLGEIFFNASEVPEVINGGGNQIEAVHQLIGGKRVVDTLGRSDDDISFKGIFRGILSLERVRYLDTLRVNGNQVSFSYSTYSYNVVVKSFKWNMRIAYQIEYEIVLTCVNDLTQPVNVAIPISFSDAILAAYTEALDIAQLTAEGGVIGALGLVGLALEAAQDLNAATIADITAITGAITNAVESVNNAIENIS